MDRRSIIAAAAAVGLALPLAACGADTNPGTNPGPGAEPGQITEPAAGDVDERSVNDRTYYLSTPEDTDRALDVIIALHGYGLNPAMIRERSRLDKADALVVYPKGAGNAWASAPYSETTVAEDAEFLDAILGDLGEERELGEIFVAGFSNGGSFAAEYACARPGAVDAVATVSAVYYPEFRSDCDSTVDEVTLHGTDDNLIEIDGGTRHGHSYLAFDEVVQRTADRLGCTGAPDVDTPRDAVERRSFTGCDARLEQFAVDGTGHVWAGSHVDDNPQIPADFATDTILEFFGVPAR